ncbi:MAG: GGDEF domain-containing protein [Anaerolineaceae bacterium]|nr:GGDEF domain-containing protein [Anaerolineaceae bacterium]
MDNDLFHFDVSFMLTSLMENTADSIYFKDRSCRLLRVSQKMASDLGFDDPDRLIGKTDSELFGEEFGSKTIMDDLHVMETGSPIVGLIESRVMPNGEINWTSTTKLPLRDDSGSVVGLLGITREINDLKRVEMDLQYLATHDSLTTLPNRFLFYDRLEQAIRRARRNKTLFAVLYIDLDSFKSINDRYGHDAGDHLLKQVALRLSSSLRGSDTVARIGGDEFTVILETLQEPEDALVIAQHLREIIGLSFECLVAKMEATASIGISVYPTHGVDSAILLKAADQAMYEAKKQGNACAIYSPSQFAK